MALLHVGDEYYCIKDVVVRPSNELCYVRGKIYTCQSMGCLTNELNEDYHSWDMDYEFREHFRDIKEHRNEVLNQLLWN